MRQSQTFKRVNHVFSPLVIYQLLTWGWRESSDIWFDVRRKGWLHILVWRQVWRDVTSWSHWRGGVAGHRRVRVVTHRSWWL